MGMLDGLLGQLGGNVDIKNLAAKVGLSEEQIESAVSALGKAHAAPGDTAETASGMTGLAMGKIQEIIGHIGGEGALAKFSGMIDKDGDGNMVDDLTDMAKGFFKK